VKGQQGRNQIGAEERDEGGARAKWRGKQPLDRRLKQNCGIEGCRSNKNHAESDAQTRAK
jgi:hypothetical protein